MKFTTVQESYLNWESLKQSFKDLSSGYLPDANV